MSCTAPRASLAPAAPRFPEVQLSAINLPDRTRGRNNNKCCVTAPPGPCSNAANHSPLIVDWIQLQPLGDENFCAWYQVVDMSFHCSSGCWCICGPIVFRLGYSYPDAVFWSGKDFDWEGPPMYSHAPWSMSSIMPPRQTLHPYFMCE